MTTVIEKPMLFSAPMVRAILEGRKTQTRRVMKPQLDPECSFELGVYNPALTDKYGEMYPGPDTFGISDIDGDWSIQCPHPVGSRIWVRETMIQRGTVTNGRHNRCYYKADNTYVYDSCAYYDDVEQDRTIASIHMPRWASRITLEVTDVRVQRLQEITKADVIAEGIEGLEDVHAGWHQPFAELWNSINGPDAWEQNPWVWAYTFRRLEASHD